MTETRLPSLETARLLLRPLVAGDAAAVHTCLGDPEAMRYWDSRTSPSVEETATRLAQGLAIDPKWHASWVVLLTEALQAFLTSA